MNVWRRKWVLSKLRREIRLMRDGWKNRAKWPGWHTKTWFALERILGSDHPLVTEFDDLWPDPEQSEDQYFYHNASASIGVLAAATFELDFVRRKRADKTFLEAIDSSLRARVQHALIAEDWTAVASLAATYVEDRFRTWAGLENDSYGTNLMTQVLRPDGGRFPLGRTIGEWGAQRFPDS